MWAEGVLAHLSECLKWLRKITDQLRIVDVPVWIRISTARVQARMLTTWAVLLCKNIGREVEASYLFVTNTSLLPCFIFGFGFVCLRVIVSVHLFSSLLKSSASVCVCVCVCACIYIYIERERERGGEREIFRKEQILTTYRILTICGVINRYFNS